LVTDGHKIVQQKKVEALRLDEVMKRVFITHRFGVRHAKPSLYCFERIKHSEQCEWTDIVYVGDNPEKDFVNLRKVGAKTIRVSTGVHADVEANPGYDAAVTIPNLSFLPDVISQLFSSR
jgi:putative hydrolase of the HAD superfamily